MSKINNLKFEYNKVYDILYIRLRDCLETYSDEEIRGVLINCDYQTDEVVGFDIWDFKKRLARNEDIRLPVEINLKEIYNELYA